MGGPVFRVIKYPHLYRERRDPDGEMGLSPEQAMVLPQWRRSAVHESDGGTADSRLRPQDILQHIITDCSVCASISVCLEHSRRFGSEVGLVQYTRLLILTPRKFGYFSLRTGPETGASLVSPISESDRVKGRYDLRLLFNGAWRRVSPALLSLH